MPPYSDNLYSANDESDAESDAESFSDELSPTDGYFHRREMPTEYLVPDPTQASSSSDDKHEIARQEARRNSDPVSRGSSFQAQSHRNTSHTDASPAANNIVPSSPVSNYPSFPISSRRRTDLFSESTPLTPGPPPAYSASPTSPIAPNFSAGTNYSTFSPHLLEQGFASRQEPESMGGPPDEASERTPLSFPTTNRYSLPPFSIKRSSPCRILIQKLLFLALIVTVIVAILTSSVNWQAIRGRTHFPSDDNGSSPNKAHCPFATIKRPEDPITFNLSTYGGLKVVQTTHKGDDSIAAHHVTTSGEIRLQQLPKDSKDGPHFTLDVRVSDLDLEVLKSWEVDSRTLTVSTPQNARLQSSGPHCISLGITVWLPEDAKFTILDIKSVTLALHVVADLQINVSDYSHFESVAGSVSFPKFTSSQKTTKNARLFSVPGFSFNSRNIEVSTISGSINGLYPLYDLLGLYSQSGSVSVGVNPHSINSNTPLPAKLEVKTTSGSISVQLPVTNLQDSGSSPPPRDYITYVQSTSGGIHGSYYLGSSTTFKTISNSLELDVLPIIQTYGESTRQGTFETRTASGSTNVRILEPIFISMLSSKHPNQPKSPYQPIGNDDPYLLLPPIDDQIEDEILPRAKEEKLKTLRSSHVATSGTIKVQYPLAWEGTIRAKSVSSRISVSGEGVSVIRETNRWGQKEVVAKKGVDYEGEGSSVQLESVSGSLHFEV